MNKKGSHVGIIISFTVFIAFLLFLYLIIGPAVSVKNKKEIALDSLKEDIFKNIRSEVTTTSISLETGINPGEDCISTRLVKNDSGIKVFVKDIDNNPINASISSNKIRIFYDDETFLKIYYSKEGLDQTNTLSPLLNCLDLTENINYSIDMIKTTDYVSEKKIELLIISYNGNYESLKTTLEFPKEYDFSFDLEYENKTKIGPEISNQTESIYVESFPIEFIDKEANIRLGNLIVSVW